MTENQRGEWYGDETVEIVFKMLATYLQSEQSFRTSTDPKIVEINTNTCLNSTTFIRDLLIINYRFFNYSKHAHFTYKSLHTPLQLGLVSKKPHAAILHRYTLFSLQPPSPKSRSQLPPAQTGPETPGGENKTEERPIAGAAT